jgi:hypothetical protein
VDSNYVWRATSAATGGRTYGVSLAINTSSAAFDGYPRAEIVRIMRKQADRIEQSGGYEETCYDVDGRVVGQWRMVGLGG